MTQDLSMNFRTLGTMAWVLAAFAMASNAGATDPAEQAAESVAAAAAQVTMPSDATDEQDATEEMSAQSGSESAVAETAATEPVAEKAEATFDEKVEAYNKEKEDDDKVVCRREKRTGSHFSRTRCVTAAQAKREREDAQESLQRASRGTNTGPTN